MAGLDRLVLEEINVGLGRASQDRRVAEDDELFTRQGAGLHQQPRRLGPLLDHSDEQADHQADEGEADAPAEPGLTVGRDEDLADRVERHAARAGPRARRPARPFSNTLGSRKAIPWPMPAGMAATAQAEARPIIKNRNPRPVGSSPGWGGFLENATAIAEVIRNMKPAMKTDTRPPANPTPRPTAAQIAARWALRHMIPSAAPRNMPIEPATVGNNSRARQPGIPPWLRVRRRRTARGPASREKPPARWPGSDRNSSSRGAGR